MPCKLFKENRLFERKNVKIQKESDRKRANDNSNKKRTKKHKHARYTATTANRHQPWPPPEFSSDTANTPSTAPRCNTSFPS